MMAKVKYLVFQGLCPFPFAFFFILSVEYKELKLPGEWNCLKQISLMMMPFPQINDAH